MNPLACIIPSRNASNLVRCIAAVREHEPNVRIIVVDDGVDWAQAYIIESGDLLADSAVRGVKPFVFARNVNIGIRAAGDSDCIILNDDALLESPGGFSLLQRAAEENPEVGLVGAVTNVTGQIRQYRMQGPQAGLRIVPHIAFICVMLPRRTLDRFGLLDEDYCVDYGVEDRAYCETVARGGLKIAVHDGCFVDHASLTSTFRGDPKASRSFAENYKIMMRKFGGKLIT